MSSNPLWLALKTECSLLSRSQLQFHSQLLQQTQIVLQSPPLTNPTIAEFQDEDTGNVTGWPVAGAPRYGPLLVACAVITTATLSSATKVCSITCLLSGKAV